MLKGRLHEDALSTHAEHDEGQMHILFYESKLRVANWWVQQIKTVWHWDIL